MPHHDTPPTDARRVDGQPATPTDLIPLADLATQINAEHKAAIETAQSAVVHAKRCGELLVQAKSEVGHGGFLEWLSENCHVGERQSRRYMRLAENWPAIAAKSDATSDLTIAGALRLLDDSIAAKSDATSDLTPDDRHPLNLPDLRQDTTYWAASRTKIAEVIPEKQDGYFLVAVYHDCDTDSPYVHYTRRGIHFSGVDTVLRMERFRPRTEWTTEPWDGQSPWYVTATGEPGRRSEPAGEP